MKKLLLILLTVLLMLPAAMRAQDTLTVADGTTTSSYVPVYGLYCDNYLKCEYVFPASDLSDMAGGSISKMTFYLSTSASAGWGSVNFKVFLTEVSSTTISSYYGYANATMVYEGSLDGTGTTMEVVFDEPYEYGGGNLLVGFYNTVKSTYKSASFYGVSATGACVQGYNSTSLSDVTANQRNFLPKTMFTYVQTGGCRMVQDLTVSDITDNSASLAWTDENATSWDIYLTDDATDIPDSTTSPTTSITVTNYDLVNLSPNTHYYVYVRAVCSDATVSRWKSASFLTPQIPAELPYTQDFEDPTENAQWTIVENGINQWVIGAAVNTTLDGENALYVSNDYGVTNNYTNSSTSTSWAYRDIDFGNDYAEYNISFKFLGHGESASYDYLKVFLGASTTPPSSWSNSSAAPQGTTLLGTYNLKDNWTNVSITVNSQFAGIQRLYLLWWNDGSQGSNPAASVDDLTITGTNCGRPYNLVAGTAITESSLSFSFTPALPTDNSWDVVAVAVGDSLDESNVIYGITDLTYEFIGLNADTPYDIYVRTDCGGEHSFWSEPLRIRTACPEYMSIPYAENFDTYGAGSNSNFLSCWQRTTNYSSQYPYISSSYKSSAPGSLCFYNSASSNYCYGITPEVDVNTNPINSLSVSFKILKSSTSTGYGALEVGVMSDPTDLSTFTTVHSFTGSELQATSTWYEVEVPLTDYAGTGTYIALRKPTSSTGYTYVDDFSVYPTPTCLKPMSVTCSQITDNSVTVAWTARSGESQWDVVVVEHGTDPDLGTPEPAYENPYTVYNLTDNTHYDVYVRANCGGGDVSVWSSVASFNTRCLPTDVIPFVENFDDYGTTTYTSYPNCWDRMTNYSYNYPYISSTHYSGVGSLYFYSTSDYYSLATSQALDLSGYGANTLMLSYKAKVTSSSYGRMDVGIMTDPTDLNTMTVLRSIYSTDYSSTSDWETFNVILPNAYTEGNVYLAFLAPISGTNYIYIDTVVLDYAPDCMSPANLEVSEVTGATARLTWQAPALPIASYTVEYAEAGTESWITASSDVAETHYVLSGLEPETEYDVRVSSNCDAGTADPITANFTTGCLYGGDVEFTMGTSSGYYVPINNYYKYSLTEQIFLASELGNRPNTFSSISFEYNYSTATTNKTNVTIYLAHTTQSSFASTSNYIPESSMQQVYTGNLNCHQGWNTFTFTTPFQYNGTDNLVLIVDDNSGDFDGDSYVFKYHTAPFKSTVYYYSDSQNPSLSNPTSGSPNMTANSTRSNVIFGSECDNTVTCIAPVVHIDEITAEEITVSWVPGYTESSWELEYKSANDADWTPYGSVAASPVTLSDLTPNTAYSIRMRSDCGDGYSYWVSLTAETECAAIATLPFTENFNSAGGSGATYFVDCWKRGTNYSTSYPYTSSTHHGDDGFSLYFYASSSYYSYAVTPRFDDEIDMSNLQVAFYAYHTSASNIEVGIMTDPTDYSTFHVVGSFSPSATSTWELAEINTDSYTGNGHYVAFRMPIGGSNYMYIDDVDIHEIPFCGRVENITASQITTNTATISWTPGGNESNWEVVYGTSGNVDFDNPTAVTEPTTDLDNLSANTVYEVYVRIVCENGEYGAWTQMNFRTACGMIDQLPFSENFDSYTASTSTQPACWFFPIMYGDAPYIVANSSHYHSGANTLFFKSETTNPTTAVTPQLDVDIHTLRVKFWLQAESTTSSGTFEVGVMSNPANTATFESVQIIQPANTSWNEYTFSLANTTLTGTGNYVAFRQHSNASNYYYWLDDVEISLIPSCAAPTNLQFDNITSTSVDVEWTDDPSEGTWEFYYCPATQTPHYDDAEIVTTNSVSLSELTPATTYNVYVRTVCSSGDGYSDYLMGSFTTECAALTTLPYTMNFDNVPATSSTSVSVNNLPICWNNFNNGTNTSYTGYPIVYNSTTYAASGSNSMRFYAYTQDYGQQIAILPPVDESLYQMSDLALEFAGRVNSTSYPFIVEVGVMTNVTDPNSFVLMNAFTFTSSTYVTQECYFDGFTGTNGRMAMRVRYAASNQANYGYVDNVVIKLAPTCRKPMGVTVQAVGSDNATLAWNGDESGNYTIALGSTATFDPDLSTDVYPATGTSYQITGLSSNTTYYAKVQTDCGGGDVSEWTDAVAILTAANAADLPYYTDFSDPLDAEDWLIFNGTQESKWYIGTPTGETDTLLYISNDNGASNSYNDAASSYVWACRDFNFGDFAEFNLDISWKCAGESSFDYMYVFVGNPGVVTPGSGSAPAGAQLLSGYLNQQTSYTHFTATLDGSYANSTKRLYLMWKNDGSVYNDPAVSVESIEFTATDCGRPYNVHASNITQTSADVVFTPAMSSDASWEYAYGPAGSNPDDLTPYPIYDTLIQLSDLDANTEYVVYVRTVCADDYSSWSNACSFFTLCDVVGIPYTENFDSYGTGESAYPNCWSKINTYSSNRPYVSSSSPYSSPASLYFYAGNSGTYNIAITPEIDATYPVNTLQATFMYKASSSTDRLVVGVMTDPTDASTFVEIGTIQPEATASTWTERTVVFNNYAGTGAFIAFKNAYTTTSSYAYIDNLVIEEIPSCIKPNQLSASNMTTNSADLSWNERGTATAWNIEYGPSGFTPGTGTGTVVNATTNPYTLTGLSASTTYDFYVQSNCGGGDLSDWSARASFDTECDAAIALPYVQNFDSYNGTAYNNAGVVPVCWLSTTNSSAYPAPHITNGGSYSYPHSNPNALTFTGSSPSTDAYAVLPEFTSDLNTIELAFAYRVESTSYGTLTVGYVTDVDNISTSFQTVATLTSVTSISLDTVSFAEVPAGTTGRLAFHWNYVGSSYYSCAIDDISVYESSPVGTCDVPTNLASSNVLYNSADIAWTAGGSESAWNLQWRAQGGTWTPVNNLTTANYGLSGLTAQTTYEVQVKAVCTDGSSDWSASHTFTTPAAPVDPCNVPTNLHVDNITANAATVTWTAGGSETSWEVQYKAQSSGSWQQATVQATTYTMEGLTPETAYEVKVKAICSADNQSDFVSTTFNTIATGIDNVTLANSISLMPNPADNYVVLTVNGNINVNEAAVYNAFGQKVQEIRLTDNQARIDLTDMASGMYFVRVAGDNAMATKKFIKK